MPSVIEDASAQILTAIEDKTLEKTKPELLQSVMDMLQQVENWQIFQMTPTDIWE